MTLRRGIALAGLGLALGLALVLSLRFGARDVTWAECLAALRATMAPTGMAEAGMAEAGMAEAGMAEAGMAEAAVAARVPRMALAALAGAALGMAGAAMQGLTRNPLADPGLLGTNAGAALAIVLGYAWFGLEHPNAVVGTAVAGAALASAAVYTIASMGRGGPTPLKLALAGAALSAALMSLTTAVVLPRGDIGGLTQAWMTGGVGGARFEQILPVLPILGLGALAALASARSLDLLALGEEAAAGLGTRIALARGLAAGGAILLAGGVTALCGPIGFVGLVVPQAARLLFGLAYAWVLPISAVLGAVLLLLADLAGRLVARPAEVEASILTAFIGAPVFIWLVRRGRVAAL